MNGMGRYSYIDRVDAVALFAPDVQNVDFGEVAANETLVREARIGNSGDAPLSVSRVKACCGAKAVLEEPLIQAGTSSLLRVELNPGALPGPFRKTITLFSDDPQNPVLIIPLMIRMYSCFALIVVAIKMGFALRLTGNKYL